MQSRAHTLNRDPIDSWNIKPKLHAQVNAVGFVWREFATAEQSKIHWLGKEGSSDHL